MTFFKAASRDPAFAGFGRRLVTPSTLQRVGKRRPKKTTCHDAGRSDFANSDTVSGHGAEPTAPLADSSERAKQGPGGSAIGAHLGSSDTNDAIVT